MSEIRSRVVGGGGQITVSLTHFELRQAFDIALARQSQNLGVGAKHYDPDTRGGLWQQVKGLVGEMALSLYLDRPLYALTSLGDYSAPDAPPNIEVRTTTFRKGALHIYNRRSDQDEHPFVLAHWDSDEHLTRAVLLGWQFKKAVAREAYFNQDKGRWEVPQAELRAMSELAAMFAEQSATAALERVAVYKAKAGLHPQPLPKQMDPPPSATPAPADSRPADAPAPIEAATPASEPGTAGGTLATGEDTSLLERDF